MAGISTEHWISSFETFLNRQELPLSSCSPNRLTIPGENSKSTSPLSKATEIINTITDQHPPELVTLAFKIIYVKSKNSLDLLDTIKKHQRYIVQLSSSQAPTASRHELSTLGQVFSGTKKFTLLSWSELLNLEFDTLSYPTAIVVSYYFFVLQGALQDVSTNLHAATKPQSGLSLLFLWDVARLFLEKSQFSRCIERGDGAMREKYSKNKTKILCGFVKVLKCLLQKKGGHKFKSVLTAFELKSSEMLGLKVIETLDLSNMPNQDMLAPFIEDYENYFKSTTVAAEESNTSVELVAVKNITDTSPPATQHLEQAKQILERLDQNTISPELAADSIMFLKSCRADEATFEMVLRTLIPSLKDLFSKAKFVDQIKQIARICFEYGNAISSGVSLRFAAELDIISYTLTSNARDLNRIKKRIEFLIWAILNLKEGIDTIDLTYSYFKVVDDIHVDDSFSRMAAKCLAQNYHARSLFFGTGLKLLFPQQILLFESIVPLMRKCPISSSFFIMKEIYEDLDYRLPLLSIYKFVQYFHIQVDLSFLKPKKSSDHLIIAAIKTESLLDRAPSESLLREIDFHFNQWIHSFPGTFDIEDGPEILLRVLNKLFQSGFYNLCITFIEKFRLLEKVITTEVKLELELLLCEATLKSGRISSTPEVLKQAGLCLKTIALESKVGVLPLHVVRWKILQLEYYLKSNDLPKLAVKLQETENLISTSEEFQLDAGSSSVSLSDKFMSLLVLARYHLLVSQYEFSSSNFAEAIQGMKFSMKLTKSVLRKADSLLDELLGLSQSTLSEILRAGYNYYRHVGLAKEAKTLLGDLGKVNQTLSSTVKLSYGHFGLTNSLVYVGEISKAQDEFKEGSKGAMTANFETLNLCLTMAVMALSADVSADDGNLLSSKVKQLCDRTDQSEFNNFEALSPIEVTELFILLNLNLALKVMIESAVTAECAKTNRQVMLGRALSVVKEEMKSITETFKARFYRVGTYISKDSSLARENLHARLMENKNCLQKMTQSEYFVHFDNSQQREVSHLSRLCSILCAPLTPATTSEEMADLNSIVHLEEASRKAPYEYHHLVTQSLHIPNPILLRDTKIPSDYSSQSILAQVLDCLPKSWNIISLDICSITGDLLVTRVRSQDPKPMIVNLPMPPDIDFQTIVCELTEIISRSNLSTKRSVTSLVKTKEDRKNWWRHRFELDIQLQDLLSKVELMISGVSEIFETHNLECSEFLDFSQNLDRILLKTFKELPPDWRLDANVSELFFGLKGKYNEETSIEALLKVLSDLLGDGLSVKPDRLKLARAIEQIKLLATKPQRTSDTHTILITSDQCTPVPWESLPLLRSKSITRMPNLLCTLALLEKYEEMRVKRCQPNELSYVINPGQDLERTESLFKPVFSELPGTVGIVGYLPTEKLLEDLIHNSNLFVFMGHGGGEQYMRMSTIMKSQEAEKGLPPALLMGCSSCAFQNNGRLPMSSNIFDWMVNGCPAVVANLWDVTDKDIDLFTMSMLESWGVTLAEKEQCCTLSLAVAKSREKCILKYLNGAAPVVYGLPLNYV